MNRIHQTEEEFLSMVSVHPFLVDSLTGFGRRAVETRFAKQLLLLIKEQRLESASSGLIVECGSGTSTVLDYPVFETDWV